MAKGKRFWLQIGLFAAILIVAYFINVEVQSYLGRRALNATGLQVSALNEALAAAREQDKRVLANVSAIWCPSCRKLDNEIFADEDVKRRLRQDFVFARLEYESAEGAAFLEKHGLRGFPNLVVLNSAGEMEAKLPLVYEPQAFIQALDQAAGGD